MSEATVVPVVAQEPVSTTPATSNRERPSTVEQNHYSSTRPSSPQHDTKPSSSSNNANNRNSWHVAKGVANTPSMRTGPPRTLSYSYSPSHSPLASRQNSRHEGPGTNDSGPSEFPFNLTGSAFRGAFEGIPSLAIPGQDKRGKRRESRLGDDSWNPIRWFQDSPKDEKEGFTLEPEAEEEHEPPASGTVTPKANGTLQRSSSTGAAPTTEKRPGAAKWSRLRSLLPNVTADKGASTPADAPKGAVQHSVNITDELIAGGLSTLMLRLWFERDEKGHRRVPVLFHRLRIRVSDSLHPNKGNKAVFRIECEYANGAARWVIYRQFRDFLSLHGHYALSNRVQFRNPDDLPDFPKTSSSLL